jgi:hypothetical protein
MQETSVEVRLRKKGPNGIPYAEIAVPDNFSLEKLAGIQKTVVRDLGRLVGLKACPACRSGMDLDIRRRFEHVIQLDAAGKVTR